jgi:hypothetical protein
MELDIGIRNFLFFEANQAIRQNSGNVAKFWQRGKILATWQNKRKEPIQKLGNQARFWQSGKILAIRQDSGNLATKFLQIIYPDLLSVARCSCD